MGEFSGQVKLVHYWTYSSGLLVPGFSRFRMHHSDSIVNPDVGSTRSHAQVLDTRTQGIYGAYGQYQSQMGAIFDAISLFIRGIGVHHSPLARGLGRWNLSQGSRAGDECLKVCYGSLVTCYQV